MPVSVDIPSLRVRVYVPSRDLTLRLLPVEMVKTAETMVCQSLASLLGGSTSWGATSTWIDESGFMVWEDVAVVESSGDPSDHQWPNAIKELGEKLRQLCNQSEVRIEVTYENDFQVWRFR